MAAAGQRFPTRLAADEAALVTILGLEQAPSVVAGLPDALKPQLAAWIGLAEQAGESDAWRVAASLVYTVGAKQCVSKTYASLAQMADELTAEAERTGYMRRRRTDDDDDDDYDE